MANKNGNNKNGKKAKNKQVSIPFVGNISPRSPWGNVFFYLFLIFLFFMIFGGSGGLSPKPEQVGVNELVKLIKSEKVQDVVVAGDKLEVQLKDGTKLLVEKEGSISFDQILTNNEVDRSKIAGDVKVERRVTFEQILTPVLMFGFPLIILFFIFRQMRNANSDIASFGKSRARLFKKGQTQITFNDVAGNEEAKTEMMEIVDFLKNPEKYRKLGARIPKGILLVGPSGVGKTLLAKAIAGEANVPFFSVAGSEFMEMLVGVGSSRVRDLFNNARQSQPSLIFIDEIDAIGRQRGMGIGGGHDEREQTLNQILIEMDGFDTRTDVIVIAATNRPDMLDPALVRPGRFDRKINIPLPDLKAREEIIKIHMRGKPFVEGVDVVRIARKTVGFSGADIENMINEAAIKAAREDRDKVNAADVDEASLKVTMGSERKTLQTEEERQMTAYHEAGHALVAATVPDMDPGQRVSIVARGGSLGHKRILPGRDRYNETKTRLLSTIATMLGGRAAEEVVYHEQTVGAGDDIKKATSLARRMVTEFGMSDLGPIMYDTREDSIWLARELGEAHRLSEKTSAQVDDKVKEIVDSCYAGAKSVLEDKRKTLDRIAKALMEKETIDQDEFEKLIK